MGAGARAETMAYPRDVGFEMFSEVSPEVRSEVRY